MNRCSNMFLSQRKNHGSPARTTALNFSSFTNMKPPAASPCCANSKPAPLSRRTFIHESVYILSGEWEESGVIYTTGAFFFAPRGEQHGPHVAKTEVISLTTFDGPLTVA